ncbi:hypothetical protein BGW38_003964, partial [Lunasporangiospora selenospora]
MATEKAVGPSPAPFRFYDIVASTTQERVPKGVSADAYLDSALTQQSQGRDYYADLVIVFKYGAKKHAHGNGAGNAQAKAEHEEQAVKTYKSVLQKLRLVGLEYETRPSTSDKDTLFVFVICPWSVLKRESTKASVQDWLAGVRVADTSETEQLLQPTEARDNSLDSLSPADRIRIISALITGLPSEGGAGIYPDQCNFVESILPIHDKAFDKAWLKSWSTKWILNQKDLSRVREHYGEKVAYYFEFLQFYFQWLAAPTGLGVFIHLFGSSFSIIYGVFVILWAIVFTECWRRREKELALWWGVLHVSKTEVRRPSFKGDTMALDPITGEMLPFFSPWKRWSRKLAGFPVILGGALALGAVITSVFGIEVFLTMYYDGYMKDVLIYLPMVLYSLAIPNVAAFCRSISERLTEYENYETRGTHEYHLMQKVFVFNALTSYMSILLTAYIYIPFGPQMITTFQAHGIPFAKVSIDPHMLQNRLKAFMVTTQAVSFATETIVPWMTRRAMTRAAKVKADISEKMHRRKDDNGSSSEDESGNASTSATGPQDSAAATRFLKRVQKQSELPVYDVNEDYAEMVLQFGYVSLFSVIWPLTGLCAFINNWIELRSDAAKICYNARRPIPSRTDTIGPWLDNLQLITWFSSITNASILYLFNGTMDAGSSGVPRVGFGMLLFCLLVSEHAYLGLRSVVGWILESVPTEAEMGVRKKEFKVKSSWISRLSAAVEGVGAASAGALGRRSLE